jgi:hypothetical protein
MLDRAWWRLNTAMRRTESGWWWGVLLFLRDRVVYPLMLATDAEQRRVQREINSERAAGEVD